ncbi:MAG: LysM peptidoglycan-binding domain-containing protein [Ferruginibacter sp.]
MKRIILLALLAPIFAAAQNTPLHIEGVSPDLYLTHTVAPKENYYSIGRLYNISPKEIAPYNNMQLEKGLSLNQVIKVPLTAGNFVQANTAAADEALVPVYYTVKEKEGLYRVSTNFNKIPVETLKQWNNIKGDAVSNGTKLIIGYLKVKKELSPLAGAAKAVPPPVAVKENVPPPPVVKETPKPEVKKEIPAVVKNTEEKKEVEEPKPVVKKEEPKETPKPVVKSGNGGYFKPDFDKQSHIAKESGMAGVFKSTSGWEDGKYYCLHNTAAPRTFVKITNPNTGKSVYAKVLDMIPDISQNNGLTIILSNAAASELGAGESKFDCTVNYTK